MEADTGYIYKMHPNPRTDGPDNPYFLQAYEQGENGELIPCDALYIGTLEKCRELLDGLNAGTLTQGQVQNIYIHGEAAPVRYYPINEAAARRAQDMNSFNDYKPGSATAEYRAMVDAAYELGEQQKRRVDPMHHPKIDRLLDRYARKLAENLNQRYAIDGRVPSILIAGGSNFPVRKKHKQNAARDRNMGEYMEIKGLLDRIRSTGMGGISADDTLAVEKLEAKLEGLKAAQESMKAVNAYYRKHKTLEGCPGLSFEDIGELQASMARDWRKDPVPYPAYLLQNNNANIHRVQQRIDDLKNRSEFASWTFRGGEAKINEEENRLQLFFDEKPTEEQRRALKSGGFRWAPSQGAWQRQLTKNAIYAADRIDFIRPEGGGSISALQPYNKKQERPAPDVGGDR